MANLSQKTYFGRATDYGNYGVSQYGIGHIYVYEASPNYLHIKTDVLVTAYVMSRYELIGYNLGTSQPVRTVWTVFGFSDGNIYGISCANVYPGVAAASPYVYKSSDGYIVLVGYNATSLYFTVCTLNAICANPINHGHGYPVGILGWAQHSASTGYF